LAAALVKHFTGPTDTARPYTDTKRRSQQKTVFFSAQNKARLFVYLLRGGLKCLAQQFSP